MLKVKSATPRRKSISLGLIYRSFSAEIRTLKAQDNPKYNIDETQWFLKLQGENISPWHELPLRRIPLDEDEFSVTGVVENLKGSQKALQIRKDLENNPVMQQVYQFTSGHTRLEELNEPLMFHQSFIPQTWVSDEQGGDGFPMDLVDISQNSERALLDINDFKVIGVLGLVHEGILDYKVLGIERQEAAQLKINSLQDYQKHNQNRLDQIVSYFYRAANIGTLDGSKMLWNGQIKDQEYAMSLIEEHQGQYEVLMDVPELQQTKGYWQPKRSRISAQL